MEPGESAARFGVDRAGVDASGGVPGEFQGLGVFRGAAQFVSKACKLAGDGVFGKWEAFDLAKNARS